MNSVFIRSKELLTRIAVARLNGVWPESQECNGILHYDWKNECYYSDFYGENEFVRKVCTKDEFEKCALAVKLRG